MDTYDYDEQTIWGPSPGAPVKTTHIDYDRREIEIDDLIAYYWPQANPFLSILLQAQKETSPSVQYMWYDKDRPDWWTELAAGEDLDTGNQEIELEKIDFINPKDVLLNTATGEIMYVIEKLDPADNLGTTSDANLKVERGYGRDDTAETGTVATVADETGGDNILKLGNAMEENSLSPKSWAEQPVKRFNYIQTFRTPFDASADNQAEPKTAGTDERARLRKEKLFEHRTDIERQILFGERNETVDTSTNKVVRMTGGLLQFIKMNNNSGVYDLGSENNGILTEAEWRNFCSEALKYGSNDKLFLTSRHVAQVLDGHAAGRIETRSKEDEYGLTLNKYITTHGTVDIATTELFENVYAKHGIMIDMKNLKLKYFDGQDSVLKQDIQENDRDGWRDEYMSKLGLKVTLSKSHYVLEGVEK